LIEMTDTQGIILLYLAGTVVFTVAPTLLHSIGVRDNHGEAAGFSWMVAGICFFLLCCTLIGCLGYHSKSVSPTNVGLILLGMFLLALSVIGWRWRKSWHIRPLALLAFALGNAVAFLGIFA